MNITNLKKSLPYIIESGVVPMLVGPHGSGKSQVIRQFCGENGYHMFDLRLGTQDVGDLIGLADFKVENDRKVFEFAPPRWLVQCIEYCEKNPDSKAIIFLDELNRGRRDVLQAMFQLLTDNL